MAEQIQRVVRCSFPGKHIDPFDCCCNVETITHIKTRQNCRTNNFATFTNFEMNCGSELNLTNTLSPPVYLKIQCTAVFSKDVHCQQKPVGPGLPVTGQGLTHGFGLFMEYFKKCEITPCFFFKAVRSKLIYLAPNRINVDMMDYCHSPQKKMIPFTPVLKCNSHLVVIASFFFSNYCHSHAYIRSTPCCGPGLIAARTIEHCTNHCVIRANPG